MTSNVSPEYVEANIEVIRRKAWNDLYFFAKYVADKDLMEIQPHKELCDFLMKGIADSPQLGLDTSKIIKFDPQITSEYVIMEADGTLKKLVMLPRGAFKSTIASQVFPIWLLWHNPNLRIMIDSETLGNAKMYLAGIKTLIDESEMIHLICVNDSGEYQLEPAKSTAGGFTEDQVILKTRTRLGLKEPTIFCSGVDNARTGMHMEVIIMDDLVSERNVKTDDQIEKSKEHYKFSLSLLEPDGLQIVIGTRYHKADLYGDLIDIGTLDFIKRPAYLPDGTLYFPSRLTEKFLEGQRLEQGSYIFNSQYMLEPLNDENSTFKQDQIQYYQKLPNIVEKYILIDPAITVKKTSDYSTIVVVGISSEKNFYVIEYKREKWLPKELIDNIFNMVAKHKNRLRVTGIEAVGGFKLFLYNIKDEMKRRGEYFRLTELSPKGVKKEERIASALEPLFSNHFMYIKMTHTELENELMDFPYGAHDDIIDALSYIVDVTRPGALNKQSHSKKYKPTNKITGY